VVRDELLRLPPAWRSATRPYLDVQRFQALSAFMAQEYAQHQVFPPRPQLFTALELCPPQRTRVLILGQDPYPKPGQAHGLCFSVPAGVTIPGSLRNIFAERRDDLGLAPPPAGDLTGWANQGVLLLNAVLTVRAYAPASHAGKGWEQVTDAVIQALNAKPNRVVFLLWGAYAKAKATLVTAPQHTILVAGHPSPLNRSGFRGCRHFSATNTALVEAGLPPIQW
jgi:uracil-DNA glycosylase